MGERCTTFSLVKPSDVHERGGFVASIEEHIKTWSLVDVKLTSNGKVMYVWEKKDD